jgi:hypothetical protein
MNKHRYFSFVIALQGFVLAKVELLLLFSFSLCWIIKKAAPKQSSLFYLFNSKLFHNQLMGFAFIGNCIFNLNHINAFRQYLANAERGCFPIGLCYFAFYFSEIRCREANGFEMISYILF